MAKGLRSKVKRRLRSARRDHYYKTQGQFHLKQVSEKLNNPHYDIKQECKPAIKRLDELKANAFLDPENPEAVFPKVTRPLIMDFRSHKIEKGGYTGVHNFRKKKAKYETVVKTIEELEREERVKEEEKKLEPVPMEEESDEEVEPVPDKKKYSVNDLMELENLSIKKKVPVQQQSKQISKKQSKKKKSKSQRKIIKF